jgi:O-antigen biosynthesis protein
VKRRRWSVVVAAPPGEAAEQWGDTWFARDVVAALERAGQRAKVVFRKGAETEKRDDDDVVLVLRGLRRVRPRPGDTSWLLWIISHPELVEADEPAEYDAVFAASQHWPADDRFGVPITPLLQATDPLRFNPQAAPADSGSQLLFAGSTRGTFRPMVRDALAIGAPIDVYGVGWSELIDEQWIRGEFIPNPELPAAYAAAHVVLNDHWPEMAEAGFLSNRLFDAVATGTRVISDRAVGLTEVFGDSVRVVHDSAELQAVLAGNQDAIVGDARTRMRGAADIAREHNFDRRVEVLIEAVGRLDR